MVLLNHNNNDFGQGKSIDSNLNWLIINNF